jgi:hypothetical protein
MLLVACLLAPGAVRMAKHLVVAAPKVAYAEAFAFVHEHRAAGDAIWVSHPQVYEVYFGRPPLFLASYEPLDVLERTARERRVWMVFNPQVPGSTCFPEVFERLQAIHSVPTVHHQVPGLEIVLYQPGASATERSGPSLALQAGPK